MGFIKAVFWEMPADFWSEGVFGKLVAFLWLFLVAAIFFLTFMMSYMVVDSAFLTYQLGQAKIAGKRFDPAHSETTYISMPVGNTTMMLPQTTNYGDRYYLQLEMNGLFGEMQVSPSHYEEMKEGKVIDVKYSKRRISDTLSFD